jgi:hypothetical protein
MATRYWVGGDGNWTDTAKWATTSGGAGGASVPTTSDDVVFDTNSHNATYLVTISNATTVSCLSFTAANPSSGSLLFTSAFSALEIYGNVNVASGVSFLGFNAGLSAIICKAFSGGVGITVTVSIIPQIRRLRFVGGDDTSEFNITSALNIGGASNAFNCTRGVVNFGSYTHTIPNFTSPVVAGTSATINLDTCTINGVIQIDVSDPNVTFNAGTSTINSTSSAITIGSSTSTTPVTFYNFNSNYTGSNAGFGVADSLTNRIYHSVTFNNFTFTRPGSDFAVLTVYGSCNFTNLTVTGALSGAKRVFIRSIDPANPQTLTITNAPTLNYVDFQDIDVAGSAAPVSGTMLGNAGNNTGITFPAPKNAYWNLPAGGLWASTAWAATSGGAVADTNFPLPQDTAIIENTGLNTNATITVPSVRLYGGINWSTRTNNFTLSGSQNPAMYLVGDFVTSTVALTNISNYQLIFFGGLSQILSIAATSLSPLNTTSFTVSKQPGSVLQLASDANLAGAINTESGILDLNGYTLRTSALNKAGSSTFTLDPNSGAVEIIGFGALFTISSPGFFISSSVTLNDYRDITNPSSLIYKDGVTNGAEYLNINISPTFARSGRLDVNDFACNNFTVGNNYSGLLNVVGAFTVLGDFTFSSNANATIGSNTPGNSITMAPLSGTTTLDTKGKNFTGGSEGAGVEIAASAGATVQLTPSSGSLTISSPNNGLRVSSGTFLTNSRPVTVTFLDSSYISGGVTRIIDMGSGVITLGSSSATHTVLNLTDPNTTLTLTYSTGAEIKVVGSGQNNLFNGGGKTLPPLNLAGTSILTIVGDNTFDNIKNEILPPPFNQLTLKITSGSTQTVNNFELSGAAGNLVILTSSTTAQHTLVYPTGFDISVNYLNISYSNASGLISTQWYAGANSTNSGNNTGWIFTNPPPPPKGEFFMIMLG